MTLWNLPNLKPRSGRCSPITLPLFLTCPQHDQVGCMALVGVELSPEMRQIDLEYVHVRGFHGPSNDTSSCTEVQTCHDMHRYMLWNLAVQRILRGCSPGLYEIQLDGVKGLAYFDPHPGNYELLGMWRERGASGETWDRKIFKRSEKNIGCICNRFVYHCESIYMHFRSFTLTSW